MSTASDLPIGPAYKSLQDIIDGLSRLEEEFLVHRDRRGIFVTAYLQITFELQRRVVAGLFRDPDWVGRYVIAFANLYRQALAAYEAGDRASVSEAWELSLDTSAAGMGLVIQDLMLGINAHINHDLPFALREVGIDPDRASRYDDHTSVNRALREATGVVQDRIAALYASGLGILDHLLGDLDEEFTSFSFEAAREHAWNMGVALVNARTDPERLLLEASVERQATVLGRMILAPTTPFPWLMDLLRAIEQIKPWWEYVVATPPGSGHPMAPSAAEWAAAPHGLTLPDDPPGSLEEVIQRLDEIIERFDRDRNRLSIYATVYRRITRRIKATVEAGGFQDPDWMTRLDLLFADRYFRTLSRFQAGQVEQIPRCWAFAFESVRAGRTMIVQDIALQIIPRVIYDLPITLREAGLDRDLDKRFQDYEKTYELFTTELDEIQDMIARKYSRLVAFEDILAGRLDEMISDVVYTRARKEAWADGLTLHNEASEEQRKRLMRRLDRKAVRSANVALFLRIPPVMWMCQAVREIEESFPGNWSEQIEGNG